MRDAAHDRHALQADQRSTPGAVARSVVLSVICGWALLFESIPVAVYGVFVGVCFHLFVVRYEEPTLQRLFGAGYTQYRANVRRWL
jgi:protein-S-isoprenylcysteine O-methyltransferase Ste14